MAHLPLDPELAAVLSRLDGRVPVGMTIEQPERCRSRPSRTSSATGRSGAPTT
ncbi:MULTISPECIES: hypothetical protein [unclassified Amycolatopsis]|uniref:hypothetical protein n=1 Tax=unclassified Amycolatopsis TaxID=2618356 RepID=UPI002E21BB35|nr:MULTISPECIES: hypothetical protein [unclassified Amycolatopsis]